MSLVDTNASFHLQMNVTDGTESENDSERSPPRSGLDLETAD